MTSMLKRRPDWRAQMVAAIDGLKRKPFGWQQHDCVSGLAAPVVKALTGEDFFGDHAGKYIDSESAYRLMRSLGFSDLADLAAHFLPEYDHPSRASIGDIAAIPVDTAFKHALGVVNGERIFVLSETGFGTVDLLTAVRAFKVG